MKKGTLFIVAVDIGNRNDLGGRCLETLRAVDHVVGEEPKELSKLLKSAGAAPSHCHLLNEHNRGEVDGLIDILCHGGDMALVSDCGTPLFSDPGRELVERAHEHQVPVRPVPGASSLTAALSVCPFKLDRFVYLGFPPRESTARRRFFQEWGPSPQAMVLLDAPYRLVKTIGDLASVLTVKRRVCLCCNLTQHDETVEISDVSQLKRRYDGRKVKKEFVLIIESKPARQADHKRRR